MVLNIKTWKTLEDLSSVWFKKKREQNYGRLLFFKWWISSLWPFFFCLCAVEHITKARTAPRAAPLLLPLVNVTASLMMERLSSQPPPTRCTLLSLCSLSCIPGGHVNPAVSLAMVILGKLKIWKFPFYVIAQFLGAFAGAAAVFGLYYGEYVWTLFLYCSCLLNYSKLNLSLLRCLSKSISATCSSIVR